MVTQSQSVKVDNQEKLSSTKLHPGTVRLLRVVLANWAIEFRYPLVTFVRRFTG